MDSICFFLRMSIIIMDEERLPKRTYDFIEYLDALVERPKAPLTANDWSNLDESTLRRMAYVAGQRALVDRMVEVMQHEISSEDIDNTHVATVGTQHSDGGSPSETGDIPEGHPFGRMDVGPLR